MSKLRDFSAALLGICIAVILWITILSREELIETPIEYSLFHALVSFVKDIQRGRINANLCGNIALFVPVGFLLPFVSGKQEWYWAVGSGFCLSALIEVIQLITARGYFDPDDIILNTLGAAIGYGLYRAIVHKKTVDDGDT